MAILDGIKKVEDLALDRKRVFIRVDFNVPLKDGKITDDFRIRQALPTIQAVIRAGGCPILASHLGRPKGRKKPELSLRPVAERLAELLPEREIVFADDSVGDGVKLQSTKLEPGQILLLENLRFHRGETAGDANFAGLLGELGDVYINDAFGTSHRAHASMAGMVKSFEEKAAGYLLMKEIENLGTLVDTPPRPFVAILGGAKVSDKIGVLESLVKRCDVICIGGAMAYTFLAAQGLAVGKSRVEKDAIDIAGRILEAAENEGCRFLLPDDHVVHNAFDAEGAPQTVGDIPNGMMGLDIGPDTTATYQEEVLAAKAVFWNGPMGVFEDERYAAGTKLVAESLTKMNGLSVVGGGDSAAAIRVFELADEVSHVSTGGGASLELVEGKELPGITALKD